MQESNFNVIIDSENYTAVIGESAKIDVGQAISNIQSGKAEIEAAVQDGKAAFNLNAAAKTQEFDDHVVDSLNEAKQWAIGEPEEPADGSSKYWAEQARYFSNNEWGKIIGTLSDQTDLQEVLDAKQDAFSAGTALEFVGGVPQSVTGSEVTITGAVNYLKALGKCEQNGTPSSANPVDILCNNGTIKVKDDELPLGYKRLLDISTTGNVRYISNVYLTGEDTLKFRFKAAAGNLIGAYNDADANDNFSFYNSTNSGASYARYNGQTGGSATYTGTEYTAIISPTGITGIRNPSSFTPTEFTCSIPLCVFATSPTGSVHSNATIYGSIEVTGSQNLNLVPCERVSDGAIGYYDTSNSMFLENQESGTPTTSGYDTSHLTEIYIDGTDETILINSVPSALTVENLLSVGSIKDEQDIFTGEITRRCAVVVYDGTQTIGQDYISSTGGLDIGAIVVYSLATPVIESVSAQSLSLAVGDVLTTSGSASSLELEVNMDAGKALNFVNPGYQTSSDVASAISSGVAGKQDNLTSANAGTGISITGSGSNVVISNTQTSAEWGNIAGTLSDQTDLQTALSGKADVDLTNVTTSGKSLISGLPMPSNRYTALTLGASGTEYTAPANGWFAVSKTSGATGKYLGLLNATSDIGVETYPNANTNNAKLIIPIKKNDVLRVTYSLTGATNYFKFIYAEGEPNV